MRNAIGLGTLLGFGIEALGVLSLSYLVRIRWFDANTIQFEDNFYSLYPFLIVICVLAFSLFTRRYSIFAGVCAGYLLSLVVLCFLMWGA